MKTWKLLLAAMMALVMLFAVSALADGGNAGDAEHVHEWGAWMPVSDPTCEDDGLRYRECKTCDGKEEEVLKATGHDWYTVVAQVEPSCTEVGKTAIEECKNCKAIKGGNEFGEATGHSVTTWMLEKKATCTEAGYYEGKCDKCGETLTEEIPATGHTYLPDESSIVAATCTEIGKVTYVCAYCGDFYTEEIPAIGHDYKVDESAIVEPTCTQVGKETYVCQNCGDFYTVEIPMVEHSWGKWVTIKDATEDEAGLQERTCSVCGATETREIGTMPETGVATVPTAALVSLMVLAMGSYVVLKKKESC